MIVAHWKMNDNAASATVIDDRGAYNGTFTDATGDPNTDAHTTTGKINTALSFDGTDDYVDIGSKIIEDIVTFTVCFWVFPTTSEYTGLVSQDGGAVVGREWFIALFTGGELRTRVYNTDGTSYEQTTGNDCLSNDQWHFVVVTVNDSTKKVYGYVDLIEVIDDDFTKSVRHDTSAVTRIGITFSSGFHFTGKIDNVMIFDTVLNIDQIKSLYSAGHGTEIAADVDESRRIKRRPIWQH